MSALPLPVAVATCRDLPDLDADGPALMAALRRAGLEPSVQVWDDPGVDWFSYRVVLLRSTWDYPLRRRQFVDWFESCPLTANPARVLAWNIDKRYLLDLQQAGVPTVPTIIFAPGEPLTIPEAWRQGEVVVKPTVSAGAADTGRYPAHAPAARELAAHIHGQARHAMVQPYLPQVEQQGETSLVYLGGTFSHAFRKAALLTGVGAREPVLGDAAPVSATNATPQQLAVAEVALAAAPGGPASLSYARVDLIPDEQARPVVLELELTEPSLFLRFADAGAADRLARHLATTAGR